jgi:hypothetical protein
VTVRLRPPTTIDLLAQAVAHVRPYVDPTLPTSERIRNLWAGVVASRDLGDADAIEDEFIRLAQAAGLARDLGRHADEDLRHVIRWGMLDRNPFG